MTERSTKHDTFTLKRHLPASPGRVWRAYEDPVQKRRWFANSGGATTYEYSLECREGGSEIWRGTFGDMEEIEMRAHYIDVVPEQRLVVAYQMKIGGKRISVSVQTTEISASGSGTDLTLTEYGAYLDGHDKPEIRQAGTEALLDELAKALAD